jgi:hypothetical protein
MEDKPVEDRDSRDIDSKDFDSKDFGSEDLDELIVYGDASAIAGEQDKPIPFDESEAGHTAVSHSPLNLGGSMAVEPPPEAPPTAETQPVTAAKAVGRIVGVKTFYAKLHPGALEYLDETVARWLKENPHVVVKHVTAATGEVQGKTTEPNLIVTVWY